MSKKIIFCCFGMVVSIIPLISCSPAIAIKDHQHKMLGEKPKTRSFPFPYDPIWNSLCANNKPGNYQNPYFCNLIIMCADGGEVFLEVCLYGLTYDPMLDDCIRPPTPVETEKCPSWPSVWNNAANVRCETLGERSWWSPLTIPADPTECCGSDIVLCKDKLPVSFGKCPEGFGYSKAVFACLPFETCKEIDTEFKLG